MSRREGRERGKPKDTYRGWRTRGCQGGRGRCRRSSSGRSRAGPPRTPRPPRRCCRLTGGGGRRWRKGVKHTCLFSFPTLHYSSACHAHFCLFFIHHDNPIEVESSSLPSLSPPCLSLYLAPPRSGVGESRPTCPSWPPLGFGFACPSPARREKGRCGRMGGKSVRWERSEELYQKEAAEGGGAAKWGGGVTHKGCCCACVSMGERARGQREHVPSLQS